MSVPGPQRKAVATHTLNMPGVGNPKAHAYSSASRPFWILATTVWLALVAAYIHAGFEPNSRLLTHAGSTPPYPLAHVIAFCVITALEITLAGLLAGLLARRWKAARVLRLGVLLGVLLLWSLPWAMTTMHQSPVRSIHMNWLLLLTASVLLALCTDATINIGGRIYRWFRPQRPSR